MVFPKYPGAMQLQSSIYWTGKSLSVFSQSSVFFLRPVCRSMGLTGREVEGGGAAELSF